jgi:hypothetical protein
MQIKSNKNILEKVNDFTYNINYGTLAAGSDTDLVINFKEVEHVSVTKTCQCTMPTIVLLPEGGFDMKVSYDSKKIGVINQSIYERVLNDKKEQVLVTFNLKGIINQ